MPIAMGKNCQFCVRSASGSSGLQYASRVSVLSTAVNGVAICLQRAKKTNAKDMKIIEKLLDHIRSIGLDKNAMIFASFLPSCWSAILPFSAPSLANLVVTKAKELIALIWPLQPHRRQGRHGYG